MKNLLILASLLLSALSALAASDFAYVYIQGDKQTPFYVKLEEGMQPRYGKNYCILSKLAPGPAHIEILFQQNAFPAQKFVIQVPESGRREFMLIRRDGTFSLYDLQQKFYLPAGNSADEDRIPAAAAPLAYQEPAQERAPEPKAAPAEKTKPVTGTDPQPSGPGVFNTGVKKAGAALAKGRDKSAAFARKAIEPLRPAVSNTDNSQAAANKDGKPTFIGGMELSTPNATPSTVPVTRGGSIPAATNTPAAPIVNSDCPNALSGAEFGKVFNGLGAYSTDEDRIEYFSKQLDKCYETWQARTLAGKLQGDAARYEMLRRIYPRITDQAAFPLLDDLLSAPAWKDAFNRLVNR